MQLQQLRYVLAAADCGSISLAAKKMYVSQSVLSVAIRDIEAEAGISIFIRGNRGVTLTPDGSEFVSYARQVVQQADLLEERYGRGAAADAKDSAAHKQLKLVISSQHYAVVSDAFRAFMARHNDERYAFALRETRTRDVIDNVRDLVATMGVIYLSNANRRVILHDLEDACMSFTSLFYAHPHVCVSCDCALANHEVVHQQDLAGYCRLAYDQGSEGSSYYAEEPLANLPCSRQVTIGDMLTAANLLRAGDSYLISTGMLTQESHGGIVAIPIDTDEVMNVGYIRRRDRILDPLTLEFLSILKQHVDAYATKVQGSSL